MRRTPSRSFSPRAAFALAAGLAALVVAPAANAHFLWLTAERGSGETVVLAFLAEPPIPDLPTFMRVIEKATYEVDGKALVPERGEETFIIRLPKDAPPVIDGAVKLGVMSRDDESFRLDYTARVQLAPVPASKDEPLGGLRMRLVEGDEGKPVIRVTFDGKPAAGASVRAYLEDGSTEELTADDNGQLECPGVAEGQTGLLAKIGDGTPGDLDGKPFDETRYYATLTVAPPPGSAAPAGARTAAAEPREPAAFAPIPQPINSFGGAVLGDWLYAYSGHTGTTHRYHTGTTNPHFYRIDLKERTTWEELPCGPALQGVALVAHGGNLYRVGGMAAHNAEGEPHDLVSVADVARFDPESRTWEDLPPLPEPRSTHDAAVLGDHLYVVGGWSMTGGESGDAYFLDDALRLDLSDPRATWEQIPAPSVHRRALAVAANAGKIYAIGGLTEEGRTTRAVDVFDPKASTWSSGPEFPGGPMQGFAPSAFGVDGRLFASGGDGIVYRLSESGDAWEPIGNQSVPRITHRLLPGIDGDLLIVGGNFVGVPVRFVESVPTSGKAEGSSATVWDVPVPGTALRSQAIGVVGGRLVAAGGNRSESPHAFESENLTAEAFSYQPDGEGASPIASLPAARQSGVIVPAPEGPRGSAFLLGGIGEQDGVVRTLGDVLRMEPSGTEWTKLGATIPDDRGMFGAASHGDSVWIFGGRLWDPRDEARDGTMPTSVLSWKPGADDSTFEVTEHQIPRPRRSFAGAELDGKYYMVGGLDGGQESVEEVDVFDFETGQWSTIPAPSRSRVFADLVALDGRLYLGGGFARGEDGHFEPVSSIEAFDPGSGAWGTVVDEVPIDADGLRVVALGGRLLLLGRGHEDGGRMPLALVAPRAAATAPARQHAE